MMRRLRNNSSRSRGHGAFVLCFGTLTAIVVLSAGCARDDAILTEADETTTQNTAERGPVRFTVAIDRREIVVGDELGLTIEAFAEDFVTVTMPVLDEILGDFEVLERETPPDIPDGDGRRWTHHYVLSTFESGELEIPSLTATFEDHRETDATEGEPIVGDLSTETMPVFVRSMLAADSDPTSYRDIKDTIEVPKPALGYGGWFLILGGLFIASLIVFILVILLRRARGDAEGAEPELPPHIWALQRLDELAGEDLLARELVQGFYFRLSGIVREYIERRFALMAPERTTDEFLHDASRSRSLRDGHKDLLSGFLREADMVKFALHRPPQNEGEEAMGAARSFVDETALRQADRTDGDSNSTPAAGAGPAVKPGAGV